MITDTPPYGPPDRVIETLEKYRETGFGGNPLTTQYLTRLSMGDEVARRVVLSLKILDLIDQDGNPTQDLIAFKQAGSSEYKPLLASLIVQHYKDVFDVLGNDIAKKSTSQVEDAFRTYRPDSLRVRQVRLFLGLCAYAGLIPEAIKDKPGPRAGAVLKRPSTPRPARATPPKLPPPPPPASHREARATLESGGHIELSVDVDVVGLSPADRQFLFDLIDRVKGYGKRPALPPGTSAEASTP